MKKKRVAVTTLGCKVNQYESAVLAGLFQERGYQVVESSDIADVYIINTCTVTHLSDRKSRQLIRRAAGTNPEALIAVTGCYAQTSPGKVLEIPGVDMVVGTGDRGKLVDLVEKALKGQGPVNAVRDYGAGEEFEEVPAFPMQGRARAFLKIQDGCNNSCTYCIVPQARGPLRSRQPAKVIETALGLVAAGFKEIVLTGIHTGSYGQDLSGDVTLAALFDRLSAIPGLQRLRLSSIEPHDITPDLVEILSGSPVFCRHLHVPLQSGDDQVLRRMGRRYTTWEYARLINVLRENIPGLALSTDLIVGFPGETSEQFENTYRFVNKISFSRLHVFKYSPRQGTPAAKFTDQVEPPVKEERSHRLIEIGEKLAARFAASMIGQDLEVLVERPSEEGKDLYEGFTDNYVRTVFPGNEGLCGKIVVIRADQARGSTLEGRVIHLIS
ncbi:tRNA (N(6)-L-threonylcarbamoyladenosine(37)-C(2))-methylthiotransferase MtaB [Pelotomaculum sp. PtaB.Bin117]|uniref:tRNA (N(6)-L-threonylcarbamoyladenosine(37)-C(2))- methylthiotransferase MtaB n=1 Tax=Pelotomaculum sp. PtaB.Bin117 TaxID=1811694 RepID=UPI0009CE19C8|nr:tRNA (N(6)-L-threonylcarbamoyladenosine(37)-C(2))-methylthiotransferase MtaB [Pelotomaculum sp. PtaB.Bin117]OPX87065.1 MAG: Threonylcarbamoyladenosine tRNA methylthiotransferase MtaB [Pelotomaculum sp. PtaB.Bin117]